MTLYIYGCQTCGTNATYIRSLTSYCKEKEIGLEIINTKYDPSHLPTHMDLADSVGLDKDRHQAIVVSDGEVTPLRAWHP